MSNKSQSFSVQNSRPGTDINSSDSSAVDFDEALFNVGNSTLASALTASVPGAPASPLPGAKAPLLQATVQPEPMFYGLSCSVSSAAAAPAFATTVVSKTATTSPTLSVSATATTTSAAAGASWISSLSTASIAADMAAADVNGTVTYAGLKTLLTDLDATLTSSKTSLTAAEMTDLKTIAANLNNGMSTSSYLTSVMNGIVNGNTENKTWTGGAASSTALGNLAAGSSATQFAELIGKWMLGTDLPSSSVIMDGQSFSVSYSTSSNAVFGAAGPSINDINQGYLGDCFLLSSLAEVAQQDAGDITSMFTSNGNNTYGVRFYVNGVADYITVNTALANGGTEFNSATDIWASLAEKAYAQLQTAGTVTGNSINDGNSWSTIGNGGAPEFALEEITGASAITDFSASGNAWNNVVYNQSFGMTSHSTGNSTTAVLSILASDLKVGDDLVLTSRTNATDSAGRQTLVASHAMSIYGYDSTSGMLEIRNPWGTAPGQTWDTTFEVSLSTLLADGDTITADNVGTGFAAAVATAAPLVAAQTVAQTWKLGQAVNFTLATTAFSDPQQETLSYSATQANGAALPAWLKFNGTTDTFSGTAPTTATSLSLKVSAVDTSGRSASETFVVTVAAAASIMAAAIASVGSGSGSVSSTLSSPGAGTSPTLASPLH